MIKAVIFDVDGVLLDSFEANLKIFQELVRAAGYQPLTRERFKPLFHHALRDIVEELADPSSEQEIQRLLNIWHTRMEYDLNLVAMPDQAEDVLKILCAQYPLGIATSRLADEVFEVPQLAKLRDCFQATVAYEDTDNHKPHPDPLLLAARRLKLPPQECVYIGDTENDLKAARSAKMQFILYSEDCLAAAPLQTTSFQELPELITTL